MDIWLCRIDSIGNIIWQKTFGNQGKDNAIKIKLTSRNTVLMIGCHDTSGGMIDCSEPYSYMADVWLVEMDLHGNILNQWCYGGTYWDQGMDIIETDDGYVIAAETNSDDGDVTGNHSTGGDPDIWLVKLDSTGQLEWENCFGGFDREVIGLHDILKKGDYDYVLAAISEEISGDVECDPFPNDFQSNAWLFEVKDCNFYKPSVPVISVGPDTVCSASSPTSTYSVNPAYLAWNYEWSIEPMTAGTLLEDTLNATVTWEPQFEGPVTIMARSTGDCGYSEWSEPHVTQVYSCMGVDKFRKTISALTVQPNPSSGVT